MQDKDTARSGIGRRAWTSARRYTTRRRSRNETIGVHLESVDRVVPGSPWLWSPTLSVAVVEDACWALTRDCWLARKPAVWRRAARRAWRAEYEQLEAKRARVVELLNEEQ